ncbi:unnamed protein product [Paramecium sonneborni]|uniref:Uncharacterized protein n=1 Tax=Paramecium sonneborni TaxID=65129 RepID=A0A8S1PFU0_9CILI|nr:unnamed protein product [Paramecium sonneborni]
MLNIKTEESQEIDFSNRFDLQNLNSDRKFVLHTNQNQISRKHHQQERKLVLPQIQIQNCLTEQSEERNPGAHIYKKQLECIKLPEIDEKFFIKKNFKLDMMNKPKQYSHSHQVSREEYEFTNSEKNIGIQVTKKVDFQEDVMIYDYINQTYRKDSINGSAKSLKLRRQQTRKLSDNLTQSYAQNQKTNSIFKLSPKSRFFEENTTKESKNLFIIDNIANDDI